MSAVLWWPGLPYVVAAVVVSVAAWWMRRREDRDARSCRQRGEGLAAMARFRGGME